MGDFNISFICPSPLVYEYSNKDTTFWAFEKANCAIPCPSIVFSSTEWNIMADSFLYVLLFSTILIIFNFGKIAPRYFIRSMFTAGFLSYSIILIIFLFLNQNDSVVCSGPGHYVKKDPFCVFQAFTTIFSIIWVEVWSVILAFDSYIHITSRRTNSVYTFKLRRRYAGLGCGLPIVCAIIPLFADNLGFDPYANLPMCLYLFHDNKVYFWVTLFIPFFVLNFLCLGLTLTSVYKIQKILVLSRSPGARSEISPSSSQRPTEDRDLMTGSFSTKEESNHDSRAIFSDEFESITDSVPSGPPETSDGLNVNTQSSIGASGRHANSQRPIDDLFTSLLSPADEFFDNSYAYNATQSYADRNSDYMDRYETPIDPACLTNVTDISNAPNNDSANASAKAPNTKNESGRALSSASAVVWNIFSFNKSDTPAENSDTYRPSRYEKWEYIIRKTIKYNGRYLLFLVMFCMTTLFVIPILVNNNYVYYDSYISSTEDFVSCLLEASFRCDDQTQSGVDSCARNLCGDHPNNRPDIVQVFNSATD